MCGSGTQRQPSSESARQRKRKTLKKHSTSRDLRPSSLQRKGIEWLIDESCLYPSQQHAHRCASYIPSVRLHCPEPKPYALANALGRPSRGKPTLHLTAASASYVLITSASIISNSSTSLRCSRASTVALRPIGDRQSTKSCSLVITIFQPARNAGFALLSNVDTFHCNCHSTTPSTSLRIFTSSELSVKRLWLSSEQFPPQRRWPVGRFLFLRDLE